MIRSSRTRLSLLVTLALAWGSGGALLAQSTGPQLYELEAGSNFQTGCIGPSLCACPALLVGEVVGTFELQELFPPLLPIRDFAVSNIQWTIAPGTPDEVTVTGSGEYHLDTSTGMHTATLDLAVGGITQQYTTTGFIPGGAGFPASLSIEIFSMLTACTYDGFFLQASLVAPPPEPHFERGECNLDGAFNVADAVYLLGFLFPQGPPVVLDCADACDANDDGDLNIADAIVALGALFPQGPPAPLPAPFPDCGPDPTDDMLGCDQPSSVCTTTLPFTTLVEGANSGLAEQVTIVRDDPTWQALWAQHTSFIFPAPPAPAVDFSQEMVVVVVRHFTSTGPDVTIDALAVVSGGIQVSFTTNACPGPLPALSQPHHMVTAPTTPGATVPDETVVSTCP